MEGRKGEGIIWGHMEEVRRVIEGREVEREW